MAQRPDPLEIVRDSPLQGMLNDLNSGRYTYGTAGDALRSGALSQQEFDTFQQAYNRVAGTTPTTRTRSYGDVVNPTVPINEVASSIPTQAITNIQQQPQPPRGGYKPMPTTSTLEDMLSDLQSGQYTYGTAGDALRSGMLTQGEFDTFQQAYNQVAGTTPETRIRSVGDRVVTGGMLDANRMSGNSFSVDPQLAQSIRDARQQTQDTLGRVEFGVGEDMFRDERQNQGLLETALGDDVRASGEGRLTALQDQQTASALREQGLEPVYELNEFQGYQYNPDTGAYDYYDNTPSMLEQAIPVLIKTGITMAVTGGLGNALAGSSTVANIAGGSKAVAGAVGQGLASGLVTAATGGDTGDILKNVALGGLGGYSKGLNEAASMAQENINNLTNIANSNIAGQSLIAQSQLASATKTLDEINSSIEMMDNINNAVKLVEAVDDKNILGAINIGLDMADLPSTNKLVSEQIAETFPDSELVLRHGDSIGKAVTKAGVKLAQGGSLDDAVKSAFVTYVKDGGGFGVDMPDMGDSNMLESLDKFVRALPTTKKDWENFEDKVKELPDQLIRALPTTKEDWQRFEEIVKQAADPVKETYIDPVVDVVRETGRAAEEMYDEAEDYVKETVAPAVRDTGRDIREAVDPVANVVRDTGRAIEEAYDDVEDFVKEDVAPAVRQTGRDIREAVDPIYQDLRELEEAGEEWWQENISGLSDVNPPDVELPDADLPDVNLPSFDIDMPNLNLAGLLAAFGGLAGAGGRGSGSVDPARLVSVQLTDPELVEGFDLSNPLLR